MPPLLCSNKLKNLKIFSLEFWKTRNESRNFSQRHEVEMIKEEKRAVIEAEFRKEVMLTTEY